MIAGESLGCFFFLNIYLFIVHSVGVVTISIDMVQLVIVT